MTNIKRYKCKNCGFEWQNPKKEYQKCPECTSEDISQITNDGIQRPEGQLGLSRRRGYGGGGVRSGPPRACKCPQCGYETEKIPGAPCRNTQCPECGSQLCGAD